jgi:hypothetical protein
MSLCKYCGRNAAIDEDLGECRFCGAPRYDEDYEDYEEDTMGITESYSIETDATEIIQEDRRYTHGYKKRRQSTMMLTGKYAIVLFFIAVLLFPMIGIEIWEPPPPPPPTSGVYIEIILVDSMSWQSLSGYGVEVYNPQTYQLVEAGTSSDGLFRTMNRYLHDQKVLVKMLGNGVYCESLVEVVVNLNEQQAPDGVYKTMITVMRLATDFQLAMRDVYGVDIPAVFDKNSNFDVLMIAQNTVENSGYIPSYDLESGYAQEAFMFFEINTIIAPVGGTDYRMQGPTSSYLVFDISPDELTHGGGYYGSVDVMFAFTYYSGGNFTITYGVVLDGRIDMYLSTMSWGNNALIFEETFDIQVI